MALRSFLFAPGNHARRVEKALTLPADAVILDLEDAVAISEKPATRELVVAAFGQPRHGKLYVRVNAYTTEWCYADIVTMARFGLDGIILPKVETADQLRSVDWLLANLERERGLPVGGIDLVPIIETALGMSNIGAIAGSGSRTKRLAFGAGDYTLDLGMVWSRDEVELLPARSAVVMASRAAGIEPPLDTVWADLRDAEGFARSAEARRPLWVSGQDVHPSRPDRRHQRGFLPVRAAIVTGRSASSPRSRRPRPRVWRRSSWMASSSTIPSCNGRGRSRREEPA